MAQQEESSDIWSRWLLNRWHGGNPHYRRVLRAHLEIARDRILDGAGLAPGMILADVGAGDGLVGFGALDRLGDSVRVIFTDFSGSLLQCAERIAVERGVRDQCSFIRGSAERLDGIADSSIDVVATRACVAFVADKRAAFGEFHRVLKPGGRISIAEPVIQDDALATCSIGKLIESQPRHPDIDFLRLFYRFRSAQYPSTELEIAQNPLTNYSERDLFQLVHEAGFENVDLEMHLDHKPPLNVSWEVFLDIAPNPWAPSPREILAQRFSPEERVRLEQRLRPGIELAKSVISPTVVFVTASKPEAA